MASRLSLTAVYEPVEHGWIQASLAELPGVITAAPTLAEAKELLALGEADGAPAQLPAGATSEAGALEVVIDAA
jgi:hypothetical protein